MHSLMRRAWVDIDLGALLRNGTTVATQSRVPLLPMVKADAYGLGAVRVARALERLDPWGYGVATIAEGEELRQASITRPIVVFTPLLAGDFDAAVRANLTPTLGDADAIRRWDETRLPWQLSIDTGMSRAGVPWDRVCELRDALITSPPQGAFTHFHSAERNDASRAEQDRRFDEAIAAMPARPALLHAENSAAIEHRGPSPWSLARPGIFLYGVGSGNAPMIEPEPVVAVRARVVDLRVVPTGDTVGYGGTFRAESDCRIATLAIGYADGYRRSLGNRGSVLIHGRRAPVTGIVTMDMTMIDVTDVVCEIGDVATLIGSDGDDRIDIADVAAVAELSPYEVLTGLRGRLPRRYLDSEV
jgi:alanine racemase